MIFVKIMFYVLLFVISILIIGDNFLVIKNTTLKKSDVIIVLGHLLNKDGTPNQVIKDRVDKGIELYNAGYAPILLFTGGGTPVESEVMAIYAQGLGINKEVIFQENKSTTTIENAENCKSIMANNDWKTAIIITSPYHSKRAFLIFRRYDYDFVIVPSKSVENLNLFQKTNDILHELLSFIGDFLQEKFNITWSTFS